MNSSNDQSMFLSKQLAEQQNTIRESVAADEYQMLLDGTQVLSKTDILAKAPQKGDKLLDFSLSNQKGEPLKSFELLAKGSLVITFYRGGWCPYCNLELRAYQQVLEEIKAVGAMLVAITPELPDASMSTTGKNELEFEVLSDVNSEYANALGIFFILPAELRDLYKSFGTDLEEYNGKGQFGLPLAATFIVKQNGIITSAFVDVDYTKRKEPNEVIQELINLDKKNGVRSQ